LPWPSLDPRSSGCRCHGFDKGRDQAAQTFQEGSSEPCHWPEGRRARGRVSHGVGARGRSDRLGGRPPRGRDRAVAEPEEDARIENGAGPFSWLATPRALGPRHRRLHGSRCPVYSVAFKLDYAPGVLIGSWLSEASMGFAVSWSIRVSQRSSIRRFAPASARMMP